MSAGARREPAVSHLGYEMGAIGHQMINIPPADRSMYRLTDVVSQVRQFSPVVERVPASTDGGAGGGA
jgi:hypothetical protein